MAKIFLEKTPKEKGELRKTSELLHFIYGLYRSDKKPLEVFHTEPYHTQRRS
ncbi:MAG: hypothetical protein ABDH29_00010 [Aquificaceae bacterium]